MKAILTKTIQINNKSITRHIEVEIPDDLLVTREQADANVAGRTPSTTPLQETNTSPTPPTPSQ